MLAINSRMLTPAVVPQWPAAFCRFKRAATSLALGRTGKLRRRSSAWIFPRSSCCNRSNHRMTSGKSKLPSREELIRPEQIDFAPAF
jgi:hypothetical protein